MAWLVQRGDCLFEYAHRCTVSLLPAYSLDESSCARPCAPTLAVDEQGPPIACQPPIADGFRVRAQFTHATQQTGDERTQLSRRERRIRGTPPPEEGFDALRAPRQQRIVPIGTASDVEHPAHVLRA
jgi:hypothetical protein